MKSGEPFFTPLVVISSIAYVVCMIYWAHSYFAMSWVSTDYFDFTSVDGVVIARLYINVPIDDTLLSVGGFHLLQFAAFREVYAQGTLWLLQLPYWFVAGLLAVMPVRQLIKLRRGPVERDVPPAFVVDPGE